ncbi:MAG: ChbG/HpnK family deacetylase, partial [Actinobacteria bacterium]|nr:ChbG/HpnK family deacetylase [Actinomycetota bacterium]
GVIEVSGSQVIDATAAGIENQLDAFVQAIKVGGTGAVPSGYESARSTNIEVVAVADPASQSIEFAKTTFRNAATFSDYRQALQHVGVEAVLIASPTPLHAEMVQYAISKNLNVLCEKPLAFDADVAKKLADEAASKNLVLQIGHWRRFSPPWLTAKRLLDEGSIGEPLMIRLSQWDANSPPASFCDVNISGGLAIDCGVHEYDLAEWFFGEPTRAVRAWNLPLVERSLEAVGDVDNLCAILEFNNSRTAFVDLSRNCRYGDDVRTEILGSQGAIFVDLLPTGRTRLATKDGVIEVSGSQVIDATAAGIENQLDAFVQAIKVGDRWRPISNASKSTGLVDEHGYMWRDVASVRKNANLDAVETELRAQIETAIASGFDVTHLDAHMGATLAPEFCAIYIRLGVEFKLPVLLTRTLSSYGPNKHLSGVSDDQFAPFVESAKAKKLPVFERVLETNFARPASVELADDAYQNLFSQKFSGLTFAALHPNAPGEVEVIEPKQFHVRTREYEIFRSTNYLAWLSEKKIKPIGMREIRDEMRSAA